MSARRRVQENRLKAKLLSKELAIGTWIHFSRAPGVARMAESAGFDFVFIDTEHSALTIETVADICEMARACGIAPLVRPNSHDPGLAGRLLDVGAMGLMFHDVRTPETVERLTRAMYYAPKGERGNLPAGPAQDYLRAAPEEVNRAVNESTLLAIQIESREGIRNLPKMLELGSVELVEIGRGDLSADLGVPSERRHPDVLAAIDDIVATCTAQGVAVGTLCSSLEDAADMVRRGIRSVVYGSDRSLLLEAYAAAVSGLQRLRSGEDA